MVSMVTGQTDRGTNTILLHHAFCYGHGECDKSHNMICT